MTARPQTDRITVLGLGYVGLPVALSLARATARISYGAAMLFEPLASRTRCAMTSREYLANQAVT